MYFADELGGPSGGLATLRNPVSYHASVLLCKPYRRSLYTYRERGHSQKKLRLQGWHPRPVCGTDLQCFRLNSKGPPNVDPHSPTHSTPQQFTIMGFGIFGNTSSKQTHPSWTSGSFPGAPPMHIITSPGYSYASYAAYSPVPTTVWPVQQQQQQQPQFVAVPYPVQVPVQVPVPVAQPMTVVSPATTTTYTQSPTPTLVMQQHTVATSTPGHNTLHLCGVPSPKISHIIPRRSPKVQPQTELYYVPVQQQQQQQVVYSQQQPQQQQSPFEVTVELITTPQQGHSSLPATAPLLPPPAGLVVI